MDRFRRIFLNVLIAFTAACERAPDSTTVVTRDSAGIRITENGNLAQADSVGWRVDTANAVIIGQAEGAEPYIFGRVIGFLRQSNGRIVVADGASQQLRFFDESGRFLHAVGRIGSGPGEYQFLYRVVGYPADTILAMESEGRGSTVLDPNGAYVRRVSERAAGSREAAPFADGSVLIFEALTECRDVATRQLCVDSARYLRSDVSGATAASYGTLPTNRRFLIEMLPGSYLAEDWRFPQPYWANHRDRLFYADAEQFEVRVFNGAGTLDHIFRLRFDRPPPSRNTYYESPIDSTLTGAERARRESVARAKRTAPVPDRVPAHSGIVVDEVGNTWVQEYPLDATLKLPPRWFVFDTAGVLRHSLRLPFGVQYLFVRPWSIKIGANYVLGVERDDDGVESVRYFPLLKAK